MNHRSRGVSSGWATVRSRMVDYRELLHLNREKLFTLRFEITRILMFIHRRNRLVCISPPIDELRQPSRQTWMLWLAKYCAGRNSDESSILSLLTFGFPSCFWLAKAHSELHDRSDDRHSPGILSVCQHHRRPATHSRGKSELFLGKSSNGSLPENWMRTRFHRNCRIH